MTTPALSAERFAAITGGYRQMRVAVVGDFCLDRYFEIDPAREERSIETGLPVHNVVRIRAQPGGAGTVLGNLAALGAGSLFAVGFAGQDGEGFELRRALRNLPGVRLDHFVETEERCTFTYGKPLVLSPGQAPRELSRLDRKNWSPTPDALARRIAEGVRSCAAEVDALVLLSQVDVPGTGMLTAPVLEAVREAAAEHPRLTVLADSRHGLRGFPAVGFKMNAAELAALTGIPPESDVPVVAQAAAELARANGQPVFVTLAERGLIGASADGRTTHLPAWPVRGAIDIVGAGDAVTANLLLALAAGATLAEALTLASAAASIVIHQLGTTGTASVPQLRELISGEA